MFREKCVILQPEKNIMEQIIYRITLFVTGIINILMAGVLLMGSKPYRQYTVYFRTRMLTVVWIGVLGLG